VGRAWGGAGGRCLSRGSIASPEPKCVRV